MSVRKLFLITVDKVVPPVHSVLHNFQNAAVMEITGPCSDSAVDSLNRRGMFVHFVNTLFEFGDKSVMFSFHHPKNHNRQHPVCLYAEHYWVFLLRHYAREIRRLQW